ncbi:unnamed protein product [Caenorhabditis angaria]|uniref:Uncharacterized protein n=1 Tax=Caenorhabditis angaria TaxID=860376 RepID=A0A9P1IBK1_9PELO|nr:unnamed protein product [Caenorhabditis angaria]
MVTVIPKVVNSQYHRTKFPPTLYIMSMIMSTCLFLLKPIFCSFQQCKPMPSILEDPLPYVSVITAPIIFIISLIWLGTACTYPSNNCTQSYNFMEMPSAVFCSLIAGISAVVEVHFSVINRITNDHLTEQWFFSAMISLALCLLHALVAFALQ